MFVFKNSDVLMDGIPRTVCFTPSRFVMKLLLSSSLSRFSRPPPPFPLPVHLSDSVVLCLFTCFVFKVPRTSEAYRNLSFSVRLISLNTIPALMLSVMARFHFSWPSTVPRRICTSSLSIHPSVGAQVLPFLGC